MSINIIGASTLKRFTAAINESLKELDQTCEFDLIQIHASPASRKEDLIILQQAQASERKNVYLVHRPDELLLYPELVEYFKNDSSLKIILLGDLVLNDPFWKRRKDFITVIPHPYFSLDFPDQLGNKITVGAYTSWGEMRKIDHYLDFLNALFRRDVGQKFIGIIGGWFNGEPLDQEVLRIFLKNHHSQIKFGKNLLITDSHFIPHVNVQLYHLNGKKRMGASSGSLHAGISLPVIFEANGMERLENIEVVKIRADKSLSVVDYQAAAERLLKQDIHLMIFKNFESAMKNTLRDFSRSLLQELL